MTKQDTSQSGFCKNSFLNVHDVTQQVKNAPSNMRLQAARLFLGSDGREVLVLDFYPFFKDLAWLWSKGELGGAPLQSLDRKHLKSTQHPYLLYLKAHFVGQSLLSLKQSEDSLVFEFTGERSFRWNLEKKEWVFSVESRKDYVQRLPNWASYEKLLKQEEVENSDAPKSLEPLPVTIQKSKAQQKFEKLKQNVETDFVEASTWLEENHAHIQFFFQNPQLWGAKLSEIPKEQHSWIESVSKEISFQSSRKTALESLKKLLSRFERKKLKAQERLVQLQSQVAPKESAPSKPTFRDEKKNEKALPKKVELADGLEVTIGRKALENDELFRKAQSRDVWFHVRGQRGAHVWIRRGQKGFGAKGELSEQILKKAAELAAKYSKASGTWIAVDCTERRFLKKLKGADPGALQVLQSKTIFVSINEE